MVEAREQVRIDAGRGPGLAYRAIEAVLGRFPSFVGGRVMAIGLRAAGVRLGRASAFWGPPKLSGSGHFTRRLTIGEHCGFNVGCYFELEDRILIHDHVSVGHDVMFLTRKWNAAGEAAGSAPIEIGSGAWLGARCTIMPGVKIGPGAVIGAAVVVSEDVPADVMLTGNRRISIAKWRG